MMMMMMNVNLYSVWSCSSNHLLYAIVTDRAGMQHRQQARPALTRPGLTHPGLRLTAICLALVCCLIGATLVIRVITWITTHLPTPEGWKA